MHIRKFQAIYSANKGVRGFGRGGGQINRGVGGLGVGADCIPYVLKEEGFFFSKYLELRFKSVHKFSIFPQL